MAHRAIIVVSALATLGLAGCGAGTTTVTNNSPPPPATTIAQARSPAARSPGARPIVHLGSFRSPSGNIGCMLIAGVARCDIDKRTWRPPPRPSSCPEIVDFGQGLEIGSSGDARLVCAGDTARDPAAPKLAYGTTSQSGPFSCESALTGLTCRRADGHGFFISIQSYRLF